MARKEESPRPVVEEPAVTVEDNGTVRETHPAFGTASVTRSSGTPRALFQSDLQHSETIRLTINTAERGRDLNRDWVHPTHQVVEVEMSLAQWGTLVSSTGLGSGVPVTLRWAPGGYRALLPYAPRIQKNLDEVNGSVRKLFARAKETFEVLSETIEEKKGVKAIRQALRDHRFSLENAPANAAFAVTSLAKAAEKITSQAVADIEAHVLTAQHQVNSHASIEIPEFTVVHEITAGEESAGGSTETDNP